MRSPGDLADGFRAWWGGSEEPSAEAAAATVFGTLLIARTWLKAQFDK